MTNDGDDPEYAGYVDEATEVLQDGEPTDIYFFTWRTRGYDKDAGFAYKNGRDLSIQLPGEIYDKIYDDPKKVFEAMHMCLVDYIASGDCPMDYIPKKVKAMFPDLEKEVAEEQKRLQNGQSSATKYMEEIENQ